MNPTILIATHKRTLLTADLLKDLLKNQGEIQIVLVVSENTERLFFQSLNYPNVHITTAPNNPLGLKWQSGVNYAKKINADPLIILGSDDTLKPGFVKNAIKLLDKYDFIGLKRFYVKQARKVFTIDYKPAMPIGGGRIYSAKALELIRWKVFNPGKNKHLDDDGFNAVVRSGGKVLLVSDIKKHGLELVALKGDWAMMNPFNRYHPNISVLCVESQVL